MSRVRRFAFIRAALATAVLAVTLACDVGREPDPGAELAALLHGRRPFGPRLTLQSASTVARDAARAAPDGVALGRLARVTSSSENVDPHLRGLFRLLVAADRTGLDRAIEDLLKAVESNPTEGAPRTNLTAAYLVRAERTESPEDRVAALAASRQAVVLAPGDPATLYDRALALDGLGLVRLATEAWRAFLAVESSGVWADDARRRLEVLEGPQRPDLWAAVVAELDSTTIPAAELRERAAAFRQEARTYALDELLPSWGDAILARDPEAAHRRLAAARLIGESLIDQTVTDVAGVIDDAPATVEIRIAEGFVAYREGRRLFTASDTDRARGSLETARERFRSAGCPMSAWAELWLAGSDLNRTDYPSLDARIETLRGAIPSESWVALRGRVAWAEGLAALRRGQPDRAVAAYSEAHDAFAAAGEDEDRAALAALKAEALGWIGENRQAWQLRLDALLTLAVWPNSRRRHNLLWEAGTACSRGVHDAAARDFLDEDVLLAEAVKEPIVGTDAFLHRAMDSLRVGDAAGASTDLLAAETAAAALPGVPLRERAEMLVRRWSAASVLARDPGRALVDLDSVLAYYVAHGLAYERADILLSRAEARIALSDVDGAEVDLLQAVELVESERDSIADVATRRKQQETSQRVHEALVLFALDQRGSSAQALEFARKARSPSKPSDWREVRAARRNSTILEYFFAGDGLLIWVDGPGGVSCWRVPSLRAEIATRVKTFATAIQERRPEAEITSLGVALYASVLAPAAASIPKGEAVAIVPDGPLYGLPFSALRASADAPYVVEEHAFYLSPPIRAGAVKRVPVRSGEPSVLIVGDPAFGSVPGLPPLPGASAEVEQLATLYPGAVSLVGQEATRSAVLAALPSSRIAHFATHALFDPWKPQRSGLYLAAQGSQPSLLRSEDLAPLDLSGVDTVVLSGCDTATIAGNRVDLHLAVGRAIIERGARAVVGSAWLLDDRHAIDLALRLHGRLAGGYGPVWAVQATQVSMLRSADAAERHPASWAGLQLLADHSTLVSTSPVDPSPSPKSTSSAVSSRSRLRPLTRRRPPQPPLRPRPTLAPPCHRERASAPQTRLPRRPEPRRGRGCWRDGKRATERRSATLRDRSDGAS